MTNTANHVTMILTNMSVEDQDKVRAHFKVTYLKQVNDTELLAYLTRA